MSTEDAGEYLGYRWSYTALGLADEDVPEEGVRAEVDIVGPDGGVREMWLYNRPQAGRFAGQVFDTMQARIEAQIRLYVRRELEEGEP